MLQSEANPEQLDAEVQDDELRAAFAQVGSAAPCACTLVAVPLLAAACHVCEPWFSSLSVPLPSRPPPAAVAQMRSSGKAAPKRLTTHQRQIVGRLLAAHGEDVAAMQHDRKLNPMQHSQGVLKAMIESFRFWKEGSGVDFRVPNKRLW